MAANKNQKPAAGSRPARPESARRLVTANRRARHEYEIEETVEAGLMLTGTEIKSIRAGKVQLQDSFARIKDGEAWLHNMHVAPYEQGNINNVDVVRTRKLLLKRRELDRLQRKVDEKGLALIPLDVHLRNGFAKVELALGKGRKLYDKREAIAEREQKRDQQRAMSERQ